MQFKTESDRWMIINALHEKARGDSGYAITVERQGGSASLVAALRLQAEQAERLAVEIEEHD